MAPILSLLVPILCLALTNLLVPSEARAFFVFGDSLVDNGNNNFLVTSARADSPPYGIDYPTHRPTGRFSNGLTIPDIISEKMGVESPLPYLHPFLHGERLLGGANFASAGVGILNDTGIQFVRVDGNFRRIIGIIEVRSYIETNQSLLLFLNLTEFATEQF
ncbi:GDSL esterase/lipase [Nymphaea thermarum]|nr:GDSL esterase/lipase [Nymphaea thermarum]